MIRISPILLTLFVLTRSVPAFAQAPSFSELRDSGEMQNGSSPAETNYGRSSRRMSREFSAATRLPTDC
jgi:hypothetical protein